MKAGSPEVCIVGAGPAGLVVAQECRAWCWSALGAATFCARAKAGMLEHLCGSLLQSAQSGERARDNGGGWREQVSTAELAARSGDVFDHFDEAHPSAAARALERIDVEGSLIAA